MKIVLILIFSMNMLFGYGNFIKQLYMIKDCPKEEIYQLNKQYDNFSLCKINKTLIIKYKEKINKHNFEFLNECQDIIKKENKKYMKTLLMTEKNYKLDLLIRACRVQKGFYLEFDKRQ